MKSPAVRIAGLVFGMLVGHFIFHPERLLPFWWQTYTDPNGNYSVEFPSKPQMSDLQVKLVDGTTAVLKVVYAIPNKSTEYFFTHRVDPRFASETVEEVLNQARDGIIREARGASLDEQRILVYGRQARDVQARSGEHLKLNMRLIADG